MIIKIGDDIINIRNIVRITLLHDVPVVRFYEVSGKEFDVRCNTADHAQKIFDAIHRHIAAYTITVRQNT